MLGIAPRLRVAYVALGLIVLAPFLSLFFTHLAGGWLDRCVDRQHEQIQHVQLKKATTDRLYYSQARPTDETNRETWLTEKSNCILIETGLAVGVAAGAFALVMIFWWFVSDLHGLRQIC